MYSVAITALLFILIFSFLMTRELTQYLGAGETLKGFEKVKTAIFLSLIPTIPFLTLALILEIIVGSII